MHEHTKMAWKCLIKGPRAEAARCLIVTSLMRVTRGHFIYVLRWLGLRRLLVCRLPLTEAEIAYGQALAKRLGLEVDEAVDGTSCPQ